MDEVSQLLREPHPDRAIEFLDRILELREGGIEFNGNTLADVETMESLLQRACRLRLYKWMRLLVRIPETEVNMYHRAWFNSVKPDFNTCFGMFPPILCLLIHSSSSDAAVELEGIDILCTRDLDVRFENNSRLRGWLMDVVIHDHPANVPLLARCMRLGATEISSHENNKVWCAHRAYMWDAFCSRKSLIYIMMHYPKRRVGALPKELWRRVMDFLK